VFQFNMLIQGTFGTKDYSLLLPVGLSTFRIVANVFTAYFSCCSPESSATILILVNYVSSSWGHVLRY